jgi:hypothetical protein
VTAIRIVFRGALPDACVRKKKEIPELVHGYIPEKETAAMAAGGAGEGEFYLRYYVGHKGKFGHEFLEFEFRPDGKLRYAQQQQLQE